MRVHLGPHVPHHLPARAYRSACIRDVLNTLRCATYGFQPLHAVLLPCRAPSLTFVKHFHAARSFAFGSYTVLILMNHCRFIFLNIPVSCIFACTHFYMQLGVSHTDSYSVLPSQDNSLPVPPAWVSILPPTPHSLFSSPVSYPVDYCPSPACSPAWPTSVSWTSFASPTLLLLSFPSPRFSILPAPYPLLSHSACATTSFFSAPCIHVPQVLVSSCSARTASLCLLCPPPPAYA